MATPISISQLDQKVLSLQQAVHEWGLTAPIGAQRFGGLHDITLKTTGDRVILYSILQSWLILPGVVASIVNDLLKHHQAESRTQRSASLAAANDNRVTPAIINAAFLQQVRIPGEEPSAAGSANGLAHFRPSFPSIHGDLQLQLQIDNDKSLDYVKACWRLRQTRHEIAVERFQSGTATTSDFFLFGHLTNWMRELQTWLQHNVSEADHTEGWEPVNRVSRTWQNMWYEIKAAFYDVACSTDYDGQGNLYHNHGHIWLRPQGSKPGQILQYRAVNFTDVNARPARLAAVKLAFVPVRPPPNPDNQFDVAEDLEMDDF